MNSNNPRIMVLVGVLMTAAFAVGHGATSQTSFTLQPTIAFSSTRDNTSLTPVAQGLEIYLTELDGVTNLRRLTWNEHQETFPDLSPDGKKLTFDSNRLRVAGERVNTSDLWVMDADGADQAMLVKRAGSSSWAPDGKNVVFHASAGGADADLIKPGQIGSAWSDSDIFVLNIDDCLAGACSPLNITNDPLQIDDDPDWSPDGSRIAFTSHWVGDTGEDSETAEIWTMNPDGSGRMRLTFNNEEERAPSWSPDGTKILYMCRALWLNSGTDFELCVMDADGSNLQVLTNNTMPDLTPNWTPDGSKIIFHRSIGGFNQLHIMNVDGTDLEQLMATVGHDLFASPGYVRVRVGQDGVSLHDAAGLRIVAIAQGARRLGWFPALSGPR